MIVFVHPLHGKERPIGRVFISYSRRDEVPVDNMIVQALKKSDIPYFIDTKDIGIAKTVSSVSRLIDDSSCGIIVLSENSVQSPWVWFEMGLMEGLGKRIIPFSLVYGEQQVDFIKSLPAFIGQYNIPNRIGDLIDTVREETFIAGKLSRHDSLREDINSDLKEASIDLIFDNVPESLFPHLHFGVLLIRFGNDSSLKDISDPIQRSDTVLLNLSLNPSKRGDDFKGQKIKVSYTIPVHKVLGTQFKFFVDVSDTSLVEKVKDMLIDQSAVDVSRATSAERQRLYFMASERDIPVSTSPEGIKNSYLFPV